MAVVIGGLSLWYTNILIEELSVEERNKVELWAEATKQLISSEDVNQDLGFLVKVITDNETVPVMLVDENGEIIESRNLDSVKSNDNEYLLEQKAIMGEQHERLEIILPDDHKNYIYYKDSILLTKLFYYPFIQLGVIFLFILVSYFAFSASRKYEQNQVWVGMAKETAHQLGTPISSLMAWVELLKIKKDADLQMISEVEKDISRLEIITDRFSKIGSTPVLKDVNIIDVLETSVNYIKSRSSKKVIFNMNFINQKEVVAPMNVSLFEWVVENLCKNAIDAMNGAGEISIDISDHVQVIYIDIKDTGKGIPKSKYKTVFQPGYTTKQRGWGLGLSLTKRIVEFYHSGKIFIKSSEINKGTTFRLVLNK